MTEVWNAILLVSTSNLARSSIFSLIKQEHLLAIVWSSKMSSSVIKYMVMISNWQIQTHPLIMGNWQGDTLRLVFLLRKAPLLKRIKLSLIGLSSMPEVLAINFPWNHQRLVEPKLIITQLISTPIKSYRSILIVSLPSIKKIFNCYFLLLLPVINV